MGVHHKAYKDLIHYSDMQSIVKKKYAALTVQTVFSCGAPTTVQAKSAKAIVNLELQLPKDPVQRIVRQGNFFQRLPE